MFLFLLLLACAGESFAADAAQKRLTGLEKRVSGVEKRVSRLENAAAPGPAVKSAETAEPAQPIVATFVKKRQVVGEKIGVRLYVDLENVSRRRFYALSGLFVFRDENGAVIWSKEYAYSEPFLPGDHMEVTLGVTSDKTKEYLKFLKAKVITVTLEKQEAYGAD
jgi:hypothetical protein